MKLLALSYLASHVGAAILSPPSSASTADESPTLAPTSTSFPAPIASASSIRNANHIFNAIRGTMRQWDSSWNHNGMSFFLATVPEGVQFYHGTGQNTSIEGMEWLAFEPEHALMFARGRPKGGPGGGPGGRRPPPHMAVEDDEEKHSWDEQKSVTPDKQSWRKEQFGHGLHRDDQDRQHIDRSSKPDCEHGKALPVPPLGHIDGKRKYSGPSSPPPKTPGHSDDNDWPLPPPPRSGGRRKDRGTSPHHGPENGYHLRPLPSVPARPWKHSPETGSSSLPYPYFHQPEEHVLLSEKLEASSDQHVLAGSPHQAPPNWTFEMGYLHFYRTKSSLNLLLIDGMSAGKTSKGTLDSQDYILRHGLGEPALAPFSDWERAVAMCNTSRDSWEGKIDGFIRMEAGFEIVLCDFEKHLNFERAQPVKRDEEPGNDGFRFYRAISDRFAGIGGDRVHVDYANMVSAFAYDFGEQDLFVNASMGKHEQQTLPRLKNQTGDVLRQIQRDVAHMVMGTGNSDSINWQAIAELFVQRYASPLQYFVSPGIDRSDIVDTLKPLLRPFVSDRTNDTELETVRCIEQFLPVTWNESFAGQVVRQIGYKICSTLITALHGLQNVPQDGVSSSTPGTGGIPTTTLTGMHDLVAYLDWPIWRECRPTCNYDEVCVLPIWPLTASVEDRKQPRCKNAKAFAKRMTPGDRSENYWWEDDEFRKPGGPSRRRRTHSEDQKL